MLSYSQAQSLKNAIGTLLGENQIVRKDSSGDYYFRDIFDTGIKHGCPLDMPEFLSFEDLRRYAPRKEHHGQLYPKFKKAMEAGEISDVILWTTLNKWVERTPILFRNTPQGIKTFEGYAKSTRRYNIKHQSRIIDHAKLLHAMGLKPYFLTTTCNPAIFQNNMFNAWYGFAKRTNTMLQAVARKFNAEYECVLESTKRGFPHAHIVLWVPEFCADDVSHTNQGKTYISGGKLKGFLKKYEAQTGFHELRRGTDKNAVYYLVKYISKEGSADYKKILGGGIEFSDSDRKSALTALCPVVARVRQFRLSRLGKVREFLERVEGQKDSEGNLNGVSIEKNVIYNEWLQKNGPAAGGDGACAEEEIRHFTSYEEALAYLNQSCINSTLPCSPQIATILQGTLDRAKREGKWGKDWQSPEHLEALFEAGGCHGCKGCALSHLIKKLLSGKDSVYDKGYQESLYGQTEADYEVASIVATIKEETHHRWVARAQDVLTSKKMKKKFREKGLEPLYVTVEDLHKMEPGPARDMLTELEYSYTYPKWWEWYEAKGLGDKERERRRIMQTGAVRIGGVRQDLITMLMGGDWRYTGLRNMVEHFREYEATPLPQCRFSTLQEVKFYRPGSVLRYQVVQRDEVRDTQYFERHNKIF